MRQYPLHLQESKEDIHATDASKKEHPTFASIFMMKTPEALHRILPTSKPKYGKVSGVEPLVHKYTHLYVTLSRYSQSFILDS